MLISATWYDCKWAQCGATLVILPGKPQSGGEMPSLPLGAHSAKPGALPGKSPPSHVCACPQEKPLGTLAPHAEDETEDGGLFIPMGRLCFSFFLL